MRKRIKPIIVLVFFAFFGLLMILGKVQMTLAENKAKELAKQKAAAVAKQPASQTATSASSRPRRQVTEKQHVNLKPIIDVSGWQLPKEMDYDTLQHHISGAIVRVFGGSQITAANNAAYTTGLDKSFKQHLTEFKKRDIPVAVYAYALGKSEEEMREEAREFYKAASPYEPSYYWIDVEEETMSNMDAGVRAFRDELRKLGAKKVGLYIGTYFMEEQEISADGFDAVWIPTYGSNSGYYDAAPATDIEYHLHQYTDQGAVTGFDHPLDLNQIAPTQDTLSTFEELFGRLPDGFE